MRVLWWRKCPPPPSWRTTSVTVRPSSASVVSGISVRCLFLSIHFHSTNTIARSALFQDPPTFSSPLRSFEVPPSSCIPSSSMLLPILLPLVPSKSILFASLHFSPFLFYALVICVCVCVFFFNDKKGWLFGFLLICLILARLFDYF